MALTRLNNEWTEFQNHPVENISAHPIDNDMFHWRGKIIGPSGTPFEGGVFMVDIVCPDNYLFAPPKYTMLTKMFHPNISSSGEIYLSIFDRDWTALLRIELVLLSISSILNTPNMEDPINVEAAQCLRDDREKYNTIVRQYTSDYAKESSI